MGGDRAESPCPGRGPLPRASLGSPSMALAEHARIPPAGTETILPRGNTPVTEACQRTRQTGHGWHLQRFGRRQGQTWWKGPQELLPPPRAVRLRLSQHPQVPAMLGHRWGEVHLLPNPDPHFYPTLEGCRLPFKAKARF